MVTFDNNSGLKKIGDAAFERCKSLKGIILPNTTKKIGHGAFAFCTSMETLSLNEGLRIIGGSAFERCGSITSVITIPSTVLEISSYAFTGCIRVREVVLNEGLKKIGEDAFTVCAINSITIPSTVEEIVKGGFHYNRYLLEVNFKCRPPSIGKNAFGNCPALDDYTFPIISARLASIIEAGQVGIINKIDNIPRVYWIDGELIIQPGPQIGDNHEEDWPIIRDKYDQVVALIDHHEIKEVTSLFELALWKAKIDQSNGSNRNAYRVEVPGPVKDTILHYLKG